MALLRFSKVVVFATSLGWLFQLANATLPDGRLNANIMRRFVLPPIPKRDGPVYILDDPPPPQDKVYYFEQLIDHDNPKLGTFKQRYWFDNGYYKPGGPIVLMSSGESNGDGGDFYLTNDTINGLIAQQHNGATVYLEHRYYGASTPFPDLSVKSLQYHTLHQAVNDLTYFAKNVHLPMHGGDKVAPGQAPWVLVGCSYAGALTAWTMTNQKNVFYAGYATSAVVEAMIDFWTYFEPIREYMPKNCSADVEAVIGEVDKVFTSGDHAKIAALKSNFGMGNVTHLDDVAAALRNNLWAWQEKQPKFEDGSFSEFCDALEVGEGGKIAPPGGFGLQHALTAWGSYWNNTYLSTVCGNVDVGDCFDTYNANQSAYTSEALGNDERSWKWILCNELGYYQESAPLGHPTLVSRIVQPNYDERICQLMFPAAFKSPPTPRVGQTNALYHGWNVTVDRLFFANGKRDPWRDATVSAEGATAKSTALQPIGLSDGFHCTDLYTAYGTVDPTVGEVQKAALAHMKTWLATWKPSAVEGQ